jgi:RND family efflux transporter MFP subunit
VSHLALARPAQRSGTRAWRLTLRAVAAAGWVMAAGLATAAEPAASAPAKAALTVTVVTPTPTRVPTVLAANGNIAAWQEALVGAEVAGLRLAEVKVDVGARVRRGQLLARFADETLRAERAQLVAGLAEAEAALAEADATLVEAAANADRARALQDSGAMSTQQVQQALGAEAGARARAAAAKARIATQRAGIETQTLRLAQTQVLAPDDGVISARNATVGAVAGAGQELFRLIRGGRLEWRAELPSADLDRVRPGVKAQLTTPGGQVVEGTVRQVAPTVDAQTRNGLVYVDLKAGADSDARAGMFARGEFRFDSREALTLPAAAVLLRDGRSVVMVVGPDRSVKQTVVAVLSRNGERVAVGGLPAQAQVVARGAAFLSDGDTVRVVAETQP